MFVYGFDKVASVRKIKLGGEPFYEASHEVLSKRQAKAHARHRMDDTKAEWTSNYLGAKRYRYASKAAIGALGGLALSSPIAHVSQNGEVMAGGAALGAGAGLIHHYLKRRSLLKSWSPEVGTDAKTYHHTKEDAESHLQKMKESA